MNAAPHALKPYRYSPIADPGFHRHLALIWGLFFALSALYCHGYALVVTGSYSSNLAAALSCVSRDWLIAALASPVLVYLANKQDLATRKGRAALVGILVMGTLALGICRLLLELSLGTMAPAELLFVYLPRYLFIGVVILLGGYVYVGVKGCVPPERTCQALVVFKGNARVVLPVENIVCISASGNYLELFTRENSYLMRGTLKDMVGRLDPLQFVRIHRSHLVRLSAVASACRSHREAALNNGMRLPLGQTYISNLPHFHRPD